MTDSLQPTPDLAPSNAAPQLDAFPATPGHTVGPYFHNVMRWTSASGSADDPSLGSILIEGTVEDGAGERLPAWLVEAWVPQAAQSESQAGSPAPGLRRLLSDERGAFRFRVPDPPPGQPAAFVTVFGLGLTRHHFTAVFPPDAEAAASSLLDAVPAARRATLIAESAGDSHWRWTIRTQGELETVFFDYC